MTTIILGVFGEYFDKMTIKTESIDFWSFSDIEVTEEQRNKSENLCFIGPRMFAADVINFLLDNIRLPLEPFYSVTCKELQFLLDNNLESKTTFWLNYKRVSTERVLEVYRSVKDQTLSFSDIQF